MDILQFTAGKWMKAAELNGQAVQLQISSVSVETFEGDQKLALHFTGKEQGMVLNKTNINTIAKAYGTESDGWIGKVVEVYPTTVEFGGKIVDALRIQMPVAPAAPIAAEQPASVAPVEAAPVEFDENSPIPF